MYNLPGVQRGKVASSPVRKAQLQDGILQAWIAAGATTFLGDISLAGILASHTTVCPCVPG